LGSPIKALYIDWRNIDWNGPQNTVLAVSNAGYNVVILAFYLSGSGAADMALSWQGLTTAVKQSTIQQIHSKGGVVLVSFGGSTDDPFGKDPVALGKQVGEWAKNNYLDGVDFDIENLAPGFRGGSLSDTATVNWLANITTATKAAMGSGAVISHAPQAPYFGPVNGNSWTGKTGGYTSVYQRAGNDITFFNVQFYNQGASCYTDYNGLFSSSCSVFPSTSVGEIAKAGIPLSKIVVGKYVTTADASNGWVAPGTLHTFFQQAQSQLGWHAGVMGWQWGDAGTCSSWIKAIYP
jgi:chitinase